MDIRIQLIKKRLKKWFHTGQGGPITLEVNPTNKCNLHCLSCLARGKPEYYADKELSKKRYLHLIKESAELGVVYCDICGGGEPFSRADITLAIMHESKRHGMIGTAITNGTLLSSNIIRNLIKIKWDYLHISLDGPATINDYLRGKGTFYKVSTTINLINYWKNRTRMKNTRLNIFSVINKKNYKYIPELVDLVIKWEIEGIYLQPVMVTNSEGKNLIMDAIDLLHFKKILDIANKKIITKNIKSNIDLIDKFFLQHNHRKQDLFKFNHTENGKNHNQNIYCFSPWLNVSVKADGTMSSCPVESELTSECNIKKESFSEIWFGNIFSSFRRNILHGKKLSFCRNCGSMEKIENKKILHEITTNLSKYRNFTYLK